MPRAVGVQTVWLVLLACIAATTLNGQEPPSGQRYALLIGVEQYDHASAHRERLLPVPEFAADDVTALSQVLVDSGYGVTLLTDEAALQNAYLSPNLKNIKRALAKVLRACRPADTVVVALAGHGLRYTGSDDVYFCPKDAQPHDDRTDGLISINWLRNELNQSFAGVKVLFVDAGRKPRQPGKALDTRFPTPEPAVATLLSCSKDGLAHDSAALRHGVFFKCVIEGLRGKASNPRGEVSFDSLSGYTRESVSQTIQDLKLKGSQEPRVVQDVSGRSPVLARVKTEPTSLPDAFRKYALVAGVTRYKESRLNKLGSQYAEDDAQALSDLLIRSGYEVESLLGEDATRSAIADRLAALKSRVRPGGVVVVGLFGQGAEADGAYFCPYDAKTTLVKGAQGEAVPRPRFDVATLVPLSDLWAAFGSSPAGHRVLLADCDQTDPGRIHGRMFGAEFSKERLPDKTAVLLASADGERSTERPEWGHGAFAKCLLEEMESLGYAKNRLASRAAAAEEGAAEDNSWTPMDELSRRVTKKVTQLTAARNPVQTPRSVSRGDGIDLQLNVAPETWTGNFHDQRGKIAERILAALKSSPDWSDAKPEITFGAFANKKPDDINAGPGIQKDLSDALQAQDVVVRPEAPFRLDGQYTCSQSYFDLLIEIQDHSGWCLKRLKLRSSNPSEILTYAGRSTELPRNIDKFREDASAAVALAIEEPQARIDDDFVRAAKTSDYGVRIQSRPAGTGQDFVPLRPADQEGFAFVPLKAGDEYEVVIKNDSPHEVGATISIDGLSTFVFSELRLPSRPSEPRYRHYILKAHSKAVIPGWHLRDSDQEPNYARFLVKEYGGKIAGRPEFDRTSRGLITVAIGLTRVTKLLGDDSKTPLATYPGDEIRQRVAPVARVVEPPHAIISIRYSR